MSTATARSPPTAPPPLARPLDETKKPDQRIQAVYLGQTDRFGSRFPERNPISEVWQIVPKTN